MVWAFSCCNNPKFSNLKVSHPQNRIQLEIIQVIQHTLECQEYGMTTIEWTPFWAMVYVQLYDVNEGEHKTHCIISFWTYLIFSHILVLWQHLLQLKQQCCQLFEKNRRIFRMSSKAWTWIMLTRIKLMGLS